MVYYYLAKIDCARQLGVGSELKRVGNLMHANIKSIINQEHLNYEPYSKLRAQYYSALLVNNSW